MDPLTIGLIYAAQAVIGVGVAWFSNSSAAKAKDKAREEAVAIANKNRDYTLKQQNIKNAQTRRSLSLREDNLSFNQQMADQQKNIDEQNIQRTASNAMSQRKKLFEEDQQKRLFDQSNISERYFG